MNGKLTIGIPTYNREKQLENQLINILKQDLSGLEEILIIDNNSNYDVEGLIVRLNCSKIRLVRNQFNIKMSTNMEMPFLYCKTEWLWLLSDDDEVLPNSINTVLNQLEISSPNIGMIKFAIDRPSSMQKETIVNTLEEYIDYYYNEKPIRRGDLVFISTNVYNISKLKKYLGLAFEFSYTYIGFWIPVFFALNDKDISLMFSAKSIVKYIPPRDSGYKYATVGKGFSILSHLPINTTKEYRKKFFDVTMSITYKSLILGCIKDNNILLVNDFKVIYNNIYRYYIPLSGKITVKLFFILMTTSITRKLTYSLYKLMRK